MEKTKRLLKITLIACLFSSLLACSIAVHKVVIEDHTVEVVKVKASQAYHPTQDGWFVSNEAMDRMLQAIETYKQKWQLCEEERE